MADRSTLPQSRTEPIFIGITGRTGAGKTSAATYLAHKYSFQYKRYSQVLAEWASLSDVDRGRLQQRGWEVMAGGMQAELNARLIGGIDRSKSAVIDGLRHLIDFQSLSSIFGESFAMIFLEAQREQRFERQHARFSTRAAFHAADCHPVEASIDHLRSRASIAILNDDSPGRLYEQLDAWIASRRSGDGR